MAVLIVALFLGVVRFPDAARAVCTGDLCCSAGTNDGQLCKTQGDCPGGACVTVLGVCNASGAADDGLPCDCPSGTCSAGFSCATGTGTCVGGPFAGACCEVTNNCAGIEPCAGTQKICVGTGANKGFGCLNDTQCAVAAPCESTGRACAAGTDFAGLACGNDADCCTPQTTCPQGACVAPAAATPTPTLTATPAATPITAAVNGASIGALTLILKNVAPNGFPSPGRITQINGTPLQNPIAYTLGLDKLTLTLVSSLTVRVNDGARITVQGTTPGGGTPTPTAAPLSGGQIIKVIAEGGGCSMGAGHARASLALLIGALVVWAARQRRGL